MQSLHITPANNRSRSRQCAYCIEDAMFVVRFVNAGWRGEEEISKTFCLEHALGAVRAELKGQAEMKGRSVQAMKESKL